MADSITTVLDVCALLLVVAALAVLVGAAVGGAVGVAAGLGVAAVGTAAVSFLLVRVIRRGQR